MVWHWRCKRTQTCNTAQHINIWRNNTKQRGKRVTVTLANERDNCPTRTGKNYVSHCLRTSKVDNFLQKTQTSSATRPPFLLLSPSNSGLAGETRPLARLLKRAS